MSSRPIGTFESHKRAGDHLESESKRECLGNQGNTSSAVPTDARVSESAEVAINAAGLEQRRSDEDLRNRNVEVGGDPIGRFGLLLFQQTPDPNRAEDPTQDDRVDYFALWFQDRCQEEQDCLTNEGIDVRRTSPFYYDGMASGVEAALQALQDGAQSEYDAVDEASQSGDSNYASSPSPPNSVYSVGDAAQALQDRVQSECYDAEEALHSGGSNDAPSPLPPNSVGSEDAALLALQTTPTEEYDAADEASQSERSNDASSHSRTEIYVVADETSHLEGSAFNSQALSNEDESGSVGSDLSSQFSFGELSSSAFGVENDSRVQSPEREEVRSEGTPRLEIRGEEPIFKKPEYLPIVM